MTHTLSSEGSDASEDGTGRGTPIVATSYAIRTANTNSNGHGVAEEVAHTLDQAQGQVVATGFHMTQDPISSDEQVPCIGSNLSGNGVMHEADSALYSIMPMNSGKDYKAREVDVAQPETIVRRLTPLECERLQGYPDHYTDNGQADSARYRQLGNSVAVPCVEWIAQRLVAVDNELGRK